MDQVWLAHIFRYDIATSFLYLLVLANHTDASTATGRTRFHDVHVLEVVDFSIDLPPLVILREDISGRTDIKSFAMKTFHPLDIAPHVIFSTYCP